MTDNTASPFFTQAQQQELVEAIRQAEMHTTGEVRLFVEETCNTEDALERAVGIFNHLKMYNTEQRNAVLIYLALADHKIAIYGDEGVHRVAREEFWNNEIQKLLSYFDKEKFISGMLTLITDVGEILQQFFPYDGSSINKNELPDDIVFGT